MNVVKTTWKQVLNVAPNQTPLHHIPGTQPIKTMIHRDSGELTVLSTL